MMLCCVCLMETPQIMSIFDELGLKLNVAEIINKHLWFKPLANDNITSQICTDCWQKIEDFHKFYKHVEKIHEDYGKNKCIIKQEDKSVSNNNNNKNVKLENEENYEDNLMQIDVEINSPSETDNNKNPLDDNDDCIGNIKSNIYAYLEDSEEYEATEISEEDYQTKEKTTKPRNKKVIKSNKNKSQKRHSTKTKLSATNDDIVKKKRMSHRMDPILTEEIIKKHIPMACNLCVYVGQTFSDIIEHFKQHHEGIKPYIMCCDKKFTRSYCIAQHAYIHENPNSFSCTECNKSFTTSYGLRIHIISYHASEEERTHACDQCPRKFGRRNLLELHKQVHIPKEQWTIVCTKCTNRTAKFATQYLLNIHNSMYHRREINICQVCAKEIKDKKAFEKHVRAHFEESGPRLKCPMENCESWLKDEDNLKNHIQRYHLDDKTYKCPDCDRVCPNRRSLSSHKHYFHSKEVFRCEQCDKTFKKALTLKEHMTQHTGETLYSCPFCTRTFNSNANMHAHKKKQHPIEWDESRKKKLGLLPS